MRPFTASLPTMSVTDGKVSFACRYDVDRTLTASVEGPPQILHGLRPNLYAFLPVILLLAGREGRDVEVRGDVDSAYFLNLALGFWPLVRRFFRFPEIGIRRVGDPGPLARDGHFGNGDIAGDIVLMFSAGVDSFYSLMKMGDLGIPPGYFLSINAGAHDHDVECWHNRAINATAVGAHLNVPLIRIDTNFHLELELAHLLCHTIRNISAGFVLFPALSRFCYSSGYRFDAISYEAAEKHGDIALIDHVVSATMTPPMALVSHLGWDATRIDKTRAVASYALSHRFLDVCTDQGYQATRPSHLPSNCSRCAKCVRTMLTLEHFGLLDRYATQFDLPQFERDRSALLVRLLQQRHLLNDDVLHLLSALA